MSERLWEDHCREADLEAWLGNFNGRHGTDVGVEQLHALFLLSSVSYFGLPELRVLLRAMYRDLFRYPLVQEIREDLAGSRDRALIEARFLAEREATVFVGMGNPAESGTHLLYYFRQENQLPRRLFSSPQELLSRAAADPASTFANPSLKRIVFVDDLCASGEQSIRYSRTLLTDLRAVSARTGQNVALVYLVVFGMTSGLERTVSETEFDVVAPVMEIPDTYATFGPKSRVFRNCPNDIDMGVAEQVASGYGAELWPDWPLGYENSQLLLAFHHNVPDNSLPILWFDEGDPPWAPAFARQPKLD